jgi:hypothetical protein
MRTYAGHSAHFRISLAKTPTEVNNNMYFLQIVKGQLIVYQLPFGIKESHVISIQDIERNLFFATILI